MKLSVAFAVLLLSPLALGQPDTPSGKPEPQRQSALHVPLPAQGSWIAHPAMPRALGAISAAQIDGFVYVVGRGHPHTLRYDPVADTWIDNLTWRQFKGDHHAAEVLDGRMFLIGGEGGNSDGKVQIFDPATNSWQYGAVMPWQAASLASACIDGLIYVAGGIDSGTFPTDRTAVYDPVADTWTELAPMPEGRNHTASATDGERLWVFGGRGPESGPHEVSPGRDEVFIYDPASDTWQWSASHPRVTRLPVARASMGKAVFRDGAFWIFGGESKDGEGATATGTYDRVDVFDLQLGLWRSDALMPTARQGIFPVLLDDGAILVTAGGKSPGGSQSDVVERLVFD